MAIEIRGPLPVKIDATSNGEFRPVPLTEHVVDGEASQGGAGHSPITSR